MISEIVHYLLYIGISLCIVAPFVFGIIFGKRGKAGAAPYLLGILMYFSVSIAQGGTNLILSQMGVQGKTFLAFYSLFFVLLETVGFFFFTRYLLKEHPLEKCLAVGVSYGGTGAVLFAFNSLLSFVAMVLAINGGNYEEIYQSALAESAETAMQYEKLHQFVLSLDLLTVIPLMLCGVCYVVVFSLMGLLLSKAYRGKTLCYLYAFLTCALFEVPCIFFTALADNPLYSYLWQVLVGIGSAVVLFFLLAGEPYSKNAGRVELNPRLRR